MPLASEPKETWRHIKKDGAALYVEVVRSTVRFSGQAACLLIASDASEKKRSEGLLRSLMDAIPSSVLLLDEELRVALANRNFLEKSHQTAGATVGARLNAVFPEVILEETGLEQQIHNVFKSNCAVEGQRLTYRDPGVPLRVYYYSVGWITCCSCWTT